MINGGGTLQDPKPLDLIIARRRALRRADFPRLAGRPGLCIDWYEAAVDRAVARLFDLCLTLGCLLAVAHISCSILAQSREPFWVSEKTLSLY